MPQVTLDLDVYGHVMRREETLITRNELSRLKNDMHGYDRHKSKDGHCIGVNMISERKSGTARTKKRKNRELVVFHSQGAQLVGLL